MFFYNYDRVIVTEGQNHGIHSYIMATSLVVEKHYFVSLHLCTCQFTQLWRVPGWLNELGSSRARVAQ
jgi:hypothetical protein